MAVTSIVAIGTTDCCVCGVVFGMPAGMLAARKADGGWFYCPNGHQQHFAETDTERLRKQLQDTRRSLDYARTSRDAARDQLEAAERSRRALRGVITRQRNRVGAGMCPVDSCRRHFADLGRHMAGEHPGFITDAELVGGGAVESGASS